MELSSTAESAGTNFAAASQQVLAYLQEHVPMGLWSVTRVENDRQTYLYLGENEYGLQQGGSHAWQDSYCVHMVAGAGPRIATDAAAIEVYAQAPVNEVIDIGAYAGMPIVDADGSLFGAICGLDPACRPDLAEHEPLLAMLSNVLHIVLTGDRALADAEHVSRSIRTEATTDPLTGVPNRRGWQEALARLDAEYGDYADPTVVIIVDLDGLKQVNDGPGGHAAGDALLCTAAQVMRANTRDRDYLARIGGDEFGIVLANCPTTLAPVLAERLADALAAAGAPASIGWAPLVPDGTCHTAVRQADQAMYAVKRTRSARTGATLASG